MLFTLLIIRAFIKRLGAFVSPNHLQPWVCVHLNGQSGSTPRPSLWGRNSISYTITPTTEVINYRGFAPSIYNFYNSTFSIVCVCRKLEILQTQESRTFSLGIPVSGQASRLSSC